MADRFDGLHATWAIKEFQHFYTTQLYSALLLNIIPTLFNARQKLMYVISSDVSFKQCQHQPQYAMREGRRRGSLKRELWISVISIFFKWL